jgi:hypothetical protein
MGPSSALVPSRGAVGPLPPIAASQSVPQGTMRPPTVIMAPRLATRSATPPADKPPAAAVPTSPAQQTASVAKKPAETAPAATGPSAPQAKPSAPAMVQPTQPMPKVQDLE